MIQPVSFSRVVCDSCGAIRDGLGHDATAARFAAAADGWKYIAWDIRGQGLQQRIRATGMRSDTFDVRTVPRNWDCCPDCEPPASPVDAEAIRSARMVKTSSGKWVPREDSSADGA
jgi:hypothetical protein